MLIKLECGGVNAKGVLRWLIRNLRMYVKISMLNLCLPLSSKAKLFFFFKISVHVSDLFLPVTVLKY